MLGVDRLNRGGDRQANAALYRIVLVRLRYHQPTKDYLTRRLVEGKPKNEIIRPLDLYTSVAQGGGLWPDGAGMPHPQPQAPTNQPGTRADPRVGGLDRWPTSLALSLAPGALSACHGVHRPRFQGQGRPPGQTVPGGQHHDRGQGQLRR